MSRRPIHDVTCRPLTLEEIRRLITTPVELRLSDDVRIRIQRCRQYLDDKIKTSPQPIYGINTGFGSLYNRNIPPDQLEKLQDNLVKSHASGTGPSVPDEIVRLMLFLKIQSLAYGHSGVQLETAERLLAMFNHDVFPVVYEAGSL